MDDQQIVNPPQVSDDNLIQAPKKNRFSLSLLIKKIIGFIKKHYIFFLILLAAIIINLLLFIFIPVVDAGKTKFVNLDSSVTLKKNQTVKLKFSGVSAIIKNFTNETCPSDKKCYGNGEQSVEYELVIDSKKYATGSVTPALNTDYQIITESSDYSSFAVVKIISTSDKK